MKQDKGRFTISIVSVSSGQAELEEVPNEAGGEEGRPQAQVDLVKTGGRVGCQEIWRHGHVVAAPVLAGYFPLVLQLRLAVRAVTNRAGGFHRQTARRVDVNLTRGIAEAERRLGAPVTGASECVSDIGLAISLTLRS